MSRRLYDALFAVDALSAETTSALDIAVAQIHDAWPDDPDVTKLFELLYTGRGEVGNRRVRDRLARALVEELVRTPEVHFDVRPHSSAPATDDAPSVEQGVQR